MADVGHCAGGGSTVGGGEGRSLPSRVQARPGGLGVAGVGNGLAGAGGPEKSGRGGVGGARCGRRRARGVGVRRRGLAWGGRSG
jgi:hypothetical protein